MEALEQQLAELETRRGTVWYYGESTGKASPQASQALACILRLGVPLRLCAKAERPEKSDANRSTA